LINLNIFTVKSFLFGWVLIFLFPMHLTASAIETVLLECNLNTEYSYYDESSGKQTEDKKSEIRRISISIIDEQTAVIGNRKNCRIEKAKLICETKGQFEDVVKNKHRRKLETFISINRNTGEFSSVTSVKELYKAGKGWYQIRGLDVGKGFCNRIEQKKLF
jgi:hypothetical protein